MTLDERCDRMRCIQWNRGNRIGQGSFYTVYEGITKKFPRPVLRCPEGTKVAVHQSTTPMTSPEIHQNVVRMLSAMPKVNHPCCVSLISWSLPPSGEFTFVTEFYPTDLSRVLALERIGNAPEGFGPTQKSCIAFGIAFGMAYLHSLNILHRDLNPRKILLDDNFFPRISGFGLTKELTFENALRMTMNIGTPVYMAPELSEAWSSEDIFGAIDVFAFGMILCEMVTGESPFLNRYKTGIAVAWAIQEGVRPDIPREMTAEMAELVQQCWNAAPEVRPLFEDMLDHPESFLFEGTDENEYDDFVYNLVQNYRL
jgi:serine/threonine protein kinase